MYHTEFIGTHYEIGYGVGTSLKQRGVHILDNVPYPITQERVKYASACLPVYQEFFPEILEEINGLVEGQRCELEKLMTVLLSMYAIPPACSCSCFAVSDGEHILLGRNSDFLTELEELNMNVSYRFSDSSYNFTGNTTAFVEIEDGVNEHGLAVGLTSVYPVKIKPGFNAGMLLRYFLEKCKSTEEVVYNIKHFPIGSAQTITVADVEGNIAVIECSAEKTTVIRPSIERPFVCATNVFSSREMLPLQNLSIDNWQAETRYETLVKALTKNGGRMDVRRAQSLLSGETGFICQYDRETGKDTVWSVIYDLKQKAIYRAEGNPGRNRFLKDENFMIN